MELLRFINAVGKHWWALMSCAIFTFLGLYALETNRSNLWIAQATFALAAIFLLIACFRAWRDQLSEIEKLRTKLEDAHAREESAAHTQVSLHLSPMSNGGPPKLAMRAFQPEEYLRNAAIIAGKISVEFRLRHLGGRPATSLSFAPIYSLGGNYSIRFDDLPFLAVDAEESLKFEVWRFNERPSRKSITLGGGAYWLTDFVNDSLQGSDDNIIYFPPLTVSFRDGVELSSQRFRLLFDSTKTRFQVMDDAPCLLPLITR